MHDRFFVITGGPGSGKSRLIDALASAGYARTDMRSYEEATRLTGLVFFDRGVPDVEGYLRLMQLPVPQHVENAVRRYRYNTRVFIAPPWHEIYTQDTERKQTFDEAVHTYGALVQTYLDYGYELVTLPFAPVETRTQFVLDRVR